MAEHNYTIAQDLREAKAMADSLDVYVKQDSLYGSVGGGGFFGVGNMPSLTVGALLMRIRRLQAQRDQMTESQRQELDVIIVQNEAVHNEWKVHYHGKMEREANSRLDAMKTFFEECAANPRNCARNYGPEVLRRTIVQELITAMQAHNLETEEIEKKARGMDSRLRRFVQGSEFIWDPQLEPVYPQGVYWWMYHQPPQPEK